MKKNVTAIVPVVCSLALFGCAEKSWDFNTEYFGVSVNDKGYITSMRNITGDYATDFCVKDKQSPLLSLYSTADSAYYMPASASYDEASHKLTLKYQNGAQADVKIVPYGKYLKFTLDNLEGRDGIDAVQWGPYRTTITNLLGEIIGVARDTSEVVNYAIGMLALDDNTIGGTADVEGDAAPFQYMIHTPDSKLYPLPDSLYEGQVFTLGGDGVSDVAFYAHKEPWYRIMYGNAALVDSAGRIYLNYQSRDRTKPRTVHYSLLPNMPANVPNHIEVEPIDGVDYIGSSIALWGSPDSTALTDVIRDIVLSEGLPYPMVNGKWVKDPSAYSPDVMTYGTRYDSIASYAEKLGFPAVHAYDQGFLRPDRANAGYLDGKDQKKKPFRFASGNKSHKEYADMLAEKGLMLGRVCITNSLAPGTFDASPNPSDSLCYQLKRKIVNDISATDTVIVVDNPAYLDEIASWEGHCPNLNIVKIGDELIHYLGISESEPYTLLNVTRGYWGTSPARHRAGDDLYKLQVTINYGYDGLIPNLALQDEIADYYAEVAANSGVTLYDFDGQEFLFNNGHGYYSTKRFFKRMFDRAQELGVPYIRFSGATLSEGSWHYQSMWNIGGGRNLYDVDTREWGSATSQGKDMRDVTYSNYYPVSFGGNFAIKDTSTVAQYEHIEAISVAYGATYFLSLGQDDVESCPQKDQIFTAIRTWEDARRADAFPRHIKKLLMRPEYDWHLEAVNDDEWLLLRMDGGKKVAEYPLRRKGKAEN